MPIGADADFRLSRWSPPVILCHRARLCSHCVLCQLQGGSEGATRWAAPSQTLPQPVPRQPQGFRRRWPWTVLGAWHGQWCGRSRRRLVVVSGQSQGAGCRRGGRCPVWATS
jgi:hypothetical protein